MHYPPLIKGTFIKRLNRFVAQCEIKGEVVNVHVPNTSRLTELQIEGTTVYVAPTDNPNRKTKYTLIHMEKKGVLINIDSQSPNQIVYEALKDNPALIGLTEPFKELKREAVFDRSRFDLYYETASGLKGFIEVKGVTYEEDEIAYFPGAPTTRGVKHLEQLIKAHYEGHNAHMIYCIQVPYVKRLDIYRSMDPNYYDAYLKAKEAGVNIHAFVCSVSEEVVQLEREVPHL
ncbi:DNA/RNA nuclease SfsA [Dolosicoccus paucivorans]